jgi:hypothetical protein
LALARTQRTLFRSQLLERSRWRSIGGASLMFVGGQILLVVTLIALGVMQRG